MVDFRYHLVSIIAIFLALALGIVVGTTALNGVLVDGLQGSIGQLTKDKRGLEGTINDLRDQVAADDQLAEATAPAAVAGLLAGQRVVLVAAPGTPDALDDALVPLLQAAGASISGTVSLQAGLLDPDKAAVVDDVVGRVAPTVPSGSDTATRAGQVLAQALLRPAAGDEVTADDATSVLQAFAGVDLVRLPSALGARATMAVLLVGDPSATPQPAGVVALADALDAAGEGAVVAGPLAAAQDGGGVRAVRDSGAAGSDVSTVDGVDRAQGRVAVVYALAEQARGAAGAYGSGPGASSAVASPPAP